MKKKLFLSLVLAFCFIPVSFMGQNAKPLIEKELLRLSAENKILQSDAVWQITSEHISSTSGTNHVYFRQLLNGLEIHGSESSMHIRPDGSILTKHLNFIENSSQRNLSGSSPGISAKQAVESASAELGYTLKDNLMVIEKKAGQTQETTLSKGGISLSNIPAKLMYHKLENGTIRLVWDISIEHISKKEWYSLKVDASTGKILNKINWTSSCNLEHTHDENHNHNHQAKYVENTLPQPEEYGALLTGSYRVFAMPLESPYYGPRTLETTAVNTTASPFGWHDTNGVVGPEFTVTRGNNVDAYEDGDNPGFQPDGGASLIFDFPYNPVYSVGDQSEAAAITNLFYWNNITHDLIYMYGFDEASGNFQTNNYGNGGLGNDWVRAEAQDGSGTCNANFSTPVDGSLPRMQMYICGTQDGSFDNLVIVHEYGHGITIRLTGGGGNSGCLSGQEQMGEGWSDWYGLMMTMRVGDGPTDSRTVGTYLLGQGAGGAGVRVHPYSTDMTVNPHTYDAIITAAVPHGVGSVWAAMLWEMTWGLIDDHGFDTDFYNGTGGNNIALAIVTEALKLQPCNPGFVDGRNAILAADVALYGGANQCTIWDAFAKRGLGVSAVQGTSASRTDNSEAFDTPSSVAEFTAPGDVCEAVGVLTNLSGGTPFGGVYSGPGVTDNGNGSTYSFDPAAAGVGIHTITYDVPASACATASSDSDTIEVFESLIVNCQGDITVNVDGGTCGAIVAFTTPSGISGCTAEFFENFDGVTPPALPAGWAFTQDSGTTITWETTATSSNSAPNAVFANDPNTVNLSSLVSPPIEIGSASAQLLFKNRYLTENNFDGMVLEFTINAGATWQDILSGGGTFSSGGYNGTLNTGFGNPLPGRQAWTGNSGGFIDTVINLAASLDGETVQFRWRMGSDSSVAATGVWIDDVHVTGVFSPDPTSTQIAGLASGSVFPVGTTTNTFEIEDASGNIAICSFDVTVNDSVDPVAIGQNLTVQLDAAGEASITAAQIDNGSSDNCAIDSMTLDITSFTCADLGANIVTLTVSDASGNSDSVQVTVTVEDSLDPVAIGQNITVQLDAAGEASIIAAQIDNGSSDNCAIDSMTLDITAFTCADIGANIVTLTVTDASGNSDSVQVTVTVEDSLDPVAIGQNITVQLDAAGEASITAAEIDNGSSDNCAIDSMTLDITAFTCADLGANTVTLTVTDASGNSDSVQVTVTVEDSLDPVAIGQNITVQLDAAGEASITAAEIDNGSSDNCAIDSMTLDITAFTCADLGANIVTLTVTDASGNSDSVQVTVTVEDSLDPVAIGQNITVQLDAAGEASITAAEIDNGSSDNCAIDSMTLDITAFTCADIGANIVTLTVTDASGNTDSVQVTVTVEDSLAPDLTCPADQTVQIPLGTFYTVPDYFAIGDATATDNCTNPITDIVQTPAAGTDLSDGTYTIEITVTDASGNATTCEFELEVVEVLSIGDQTFNNQSIILYPNPTTGEVTILNRSNIQLQSALITDVNGRIIQSIDLTSLNGEMKISLSNLATGLYFVQISTEHATLVKRIVKK